MKGGAPRGDRLVEVTRLGDLARVAVIDPESGLEASVSGPPTALAELELLAHRKLERLIAAAGQEPARSEPSPQTPPRPPRPGLLI